MNNPDSTRGSDLRRQLGLFDSAMIMIGIIIGSGIFLTTGIMAKSSPSALLILLAFGVGGLFTLAGALTYAELGASLPEAGGQYVYLKIAFGPLSGFLFGWISFLVYLSGGIAALAVAFADYCGYLFPALEASKAVLRVSFGTFHYSLSVGQVIAAGLILFLSWVNFLGVTLGKTIQNLFTATKIGAILLFIVLGIAVAKGTSVDFSLNPSGLDWDLIVTGFGVSLIAVFWTFDGWNNINFAAGEIKNPARNLPLVLMLGTLVSTGLYLGINYVYLLSLPIIEMTGVVRIAERSSTELFGSGSAQLMSAVVLISVFSSLNGSIFAGSRLYFSMARDGLFFRRAARVHPRFRTPGFSLLIQAIWSAFLTLTGSFEQLITYTMFIAVVFWVAATASVFALRRKLPDLPRPYRTWGYPYVPLMFIVASVGILLNTLLASPLESLSGLGLALLGLPVYYYWRRGGRPSVSESTRRD